MTLRQTRIYAPNHPPVDQDNWAETIMGQVVKPLVENQQGLNWFWFTRYGESFKDTQGRERNDFPWEKFAHEPVRSMLFRFDISEDMRQSFEAEGSRLIRSVGCVQTEWIPYDDGELCSGRFLGEDRTKARERERLPLVKAYLQSICRLVLHALVDADDQGRWRFENNDSDQNPGGSTFFSLHHLFCNTTEVPLSVRVVQCPTILGVGTWMYPPQVTNQVAVQVDDIPVRF